MRGRWRECYGSYLSIIIIIMYLCTSSEEKLFTCKISGSFVLWLVSFAFSKEEEDEDEHRQFVKITFTCILHLA